MKKIDGYNSAENSNSSDPSQKAEKDFFWGNSEILDPDDNEFAARMVEIAGILSSSLDLDIVQNHVVDIIEKVIPANACNLMIVHGNEGQVVHQHGYGQLGTAELISSRIFDLQKTKTFAKMLQSKQGLVIPDTRQNLQWAPMPESFWVRSFVSTPILLGNRVYAFINCDHGVPGTFNEKHSARLKQLADLAALAISNALVYAETNNRLKQIGLINEMTQSMLDSTQLDEVLKTLPQKILSVFDANSLIITKWDDEQKSVSQLAAFGPGLMPCPPKSHKPDGFCITEQVIKQKRPLVISNEAEYDPWLKDLSRLMADHVILALPMIAQENLLGAILIGFKDHRQISQADVSIGEYASLQIATIINKWNVYEKAKIQSDQFQHANDLIASLSIVATSILSTKGLESIIQTMGDGLEKMGIHSLLFFIDFDLNSLTLEYCSRMEKLQSALNSLGHSTNPKTKIKIPPLEQLQNTLLNQQIEFIDDPVQLLKLMFPSEYGPFIGKFQEALEINAETKALFMPLIVEQKTIGLLGLYGKNLQEVDLRAGEIFNSQISVALENSRLLAEVQRLAITDELTGIKNRRGLFECGNRELAIAKRTHRPLGVLMIDLDNFKDVNDKYGHAVGDVVLREVARRISQHIREIDIFGRYGGEEFVVLLSENDLAFSLLIAERIRQAIANDGIPTGSDIIHITASVGVDELDLSITNLDQLIKKADQALYIAKNNGRNQVATNQNKENIYF